MFGMKTRKDGKDYWPSEFSRKEKRMFARQYGSSLAVYDAHTLGEYEAMKRKPRGNPFPPGRRHDAFAAAFAQADPMGDHHGRNE
jgi:hypothetical protein